MIAPFLLRFFMNNLVKEEEKTSYLILIETEENQKKSWTDSG
jgi:hypothetical protein